MTYEKIYMATDSLLVFVSTTNKIFFHFCVWKFYSVLGTDDIDDRKIFFQSRIQDRVWPGSWVESGASSLIFEGNSRRLFTLRSLENYFALETFGCFLHNTKIFPAPTFSEKLFVRRKTGNAYFFKLNFSCFSWNINCWMISCIFRLPEKRYNYQVEVKLALDLS